MKRMALAVTLALSMTTVTAQEQQVTHDWSSTDHHPHFGDIDGDGVKDLLLQAKTPDQLSQLVLSATNQSVTLEQPLSATKLTLADVNGDGFADLFAVYSDENMARTFLGNAQGLQKTDDLNYTIWWLGWLAETPEFELSVGDFDGDEREDVFVRAKQPNQPHYLIYAGNKKFKTAKRIKAKLTGENWHSDEYSVGVGNIDDDKGEELVRFNNMPGGIDENGQIVTGVRAANSANHSYALSKGKAGTTQSLVGVPSTPTNYPGNDGNSYKPVGYSYNVPFDSVSGATYYELYESQNGSGYTKVYSGSATSVSRIQHSYGYQYYKYKACNGAGCSGLSPWRRLYVYTTPGTPGGVGVSPVGVATDTSYTLSWNASNGAVDGVVYTVYESHNNGSESVVYTVNRAHWSETGYSYSTTRSNGGEYRYRVQPCNPVLPCGGSAYTYQTVIAPNTAPLAYDDTATVNQNSYVDIPVLNNDTDAEGHSLSPSIYANPSNGSVNINGSYIRYTPNTNYAGNDGFYYQAKDSEGAYSDTAWVTVTVNATMATPVLSRVSTPKMLEYSLQWTTSSGATRYEIYEQKNGGTWKQVYNGASTSMLFTQPIIANYDYMARACNNSECTNWSSALPAMRLKDTYTASDVLGTPIMRTNNSRAFEATKHSYPFGQQENKQ